MALLVSGIYIDEASTDLRDTVARRLALPPAQVLSCTCVRESIDARWGHPRRVASFRVEVAVDEEAILAHPPANVRRFTDRDSQRAGNGPLAPPPAPPPREIPTVRPIIVGAGPGGLFAALRLAEAGIRPILVERGGPVETRTPLVHRFWRTGQLDPESNVLFGEGGAGAFSDGKIYTRRRDGEVGWILQRFVDHGAAPGILTDSHPHLGTDRLRHILPSLRARLQELGTEIRFHTRVRGLRVEDGRCVGVTLADGAELDGSPVVLAPGHSARDTFEALIDAGLQAEPRPIAVGVRVEHPQVLLDRALHGPRHAEFPPAAYRLTWNPPGTGGGGGGSRNRPAPLRSAWTFCNCPGGIVVAATHRDGELCLNGMSFARRSGPLANAALVAQVLPQDFEGQDPLAGVRYQEAIERTAWRAGGGDFTAPAQRIPDFLARRTSRELPRSSYARGIVPADLRDVLPAPVLRSIEAALRAFEGRIPGFTGESGVMIAPETRTACPIRFTRNDARVSVTVKDVYPVGEGAGYAGGIVSAALDGVKAADAILALTARRA